MVGIKGGIVSKYSLFIVLLLFTAFAWASPVSAGELDCLPGFRAEVDTKTLVDYQGALRVSAPLEKKTCERIDGLVIGEDYSLGDYSVMHYISLSYEADKSEADSKFAGLVFPLDLIAVIEENKKGHSYFLFSIDVYVREKGHANFFNDEKNIPLVIYADKKKVSLKARGVGSGIASFGAMFHIPFSLAPSDIGTLLSADEFSFVIPLSHELVEKRKGRFSIKVSLTEEGTKDLKSFLKVVQKYSGYRGAKSKN
ncbi:MAG: hypothetical protein A2179_06125 [Elusimicrobia bacterium GWC2_63_65]|nr:MAG: hypothetical protein A2179_06125 [Elusimicrobia bacterium GWC2_63_65]